MKASKILSVALAASMTLPLFLTAQSAADKKNYINISEEQFIENGTFDSMPDINRSNFGFEWHKHVDGQWNYSCNSGASAVLTYNDQDGYLHIAAESWPSISYGVPGTVPAGEYRLSFDIYVESGITNFKLRAHRMTGTSSSTDFTGEQSFSAAVGTWKNISFPITLTEDSDMLFRFYPAGNSTFRIDNVALGVPGDTLIESADLDSVSATAVGSITPGAPENGVFTASKANFVTFDTSSEQLSVKRNPSDKLIPGTPTIAYCFDKTVTAGDYRIAFDLSSETAQKYSVEIYNGNKESQKFYPLTATSQAFTFNTCTYDITVPSGTDGALIAFRLFPLSGSGEYCSQPYSIDNVRLYKKESSKVILEEGFDTPAAVKVYNKTPDSGYTGTDWNGMANVPDGHWFLMDGSLGTQTTFFGPTTATISDSSVTCLNYDKIENNTPSFGYAFGALPKGKYIVTFDTYATAAHTITAANTTGNPAVRIHYGTGNTERPVTASIDFKKDQWSTGRIEFEVADNNMSRYLFRFWGCPDFYLDNFKITVINDTYEWTLQENDLSAVPPNTASDGKMSVRNVEYKWYLMSDGEWSYSNASGASNFVNSMTYNASEGYIYVDCENGPPVGHAPYGTLAAGNYVLKLNIKPKETKAFSFDIQTVTATSGSSLISPFPGQTLTKDVWNTVSIPFTLTAAKDIIFRFWTSGGCDFYIGGYSIEKSETSFYNPLASNDYSSVSGISAVAYNDASVTTANAKQYKGKWVSRDLAGMKFAYDSAGKRIQVLPSDYIYGNASVMYGFETTFSRGDYAVDLTFKPEHSCKYKISLVNRADGSELYSITTASPLAGGVSTTLSLPVSVDSDTDVVLRIAAAELTCYSPFTVSDISVYKSGYPINGLTSNGSLAMFDTADGIYYLSKDPSGSSAYVKYSNCEELRAGKYILSGYFSTESTGGAELTACVGQIPCDGSFTVDGQWTYVEFPIAVSKKLSFERFDGIRFNLTGNATFRFKDLSLTYEGELPTPAMNSGIAMVLLKKLSGELKTEVKEEANNFVVNGSFDTEPPIADAPLKYEFTKAVPGVWAYSSSAEGPSIKYGETKKELCLTVSAGGTTPCISYLIPEELAGGSYSLSLDIFVEGSGTKSFSLDVFDISSGSTVRLGENGEIMKRNVKAGEWSTVTVPFALNSNGKVLFRFWCDSPVNYSIDNVTVN